MICIPSANPETSFGLGPRDLIHSLSTLLASFRGGNPAVVGILQEKLTTLGLSVLSPRRLVDFSSASEDERDIKHSPQSIAWNEDALYTPVTALASDFPVAMGTIL